MTKKLVECKSVPAWLPESLAKEVDEMTRTLPVGCDYVRKAYIPATMFEPGERAEVSILTTATVDKTNEVVLPEGVELDTYRKNNIVLYNHDQESIVGESVWIKFVERDRSLRAKTSYYENTEGIESRWYKFVDETWYMVKAGALKAKSIGFQPLKPKREPTAEELEQHPEWEGAGVWDSTLLLEYSVCPVGINNDALVEAVNTKSLDPDRLKAMGLEVGEVGEDVLLAVEERRESPLARYKADECVSKKIKVMHERGETKDYTDEQIIAMAYAHCHGKALPRRAPKKKALAPLLAKALDAINIDLRGIVRRGESRCRC